MPNKKPAWKSQTEIADVLGVSRQAVQKLCKGKFKLAVCTEGKEKGKINRWHPVIVQHKEELETKRAESGPKPTKSKKPTDKKKDSGPHYINTEVTIEDIEHMTIKEVVERYRGMVGFKNYMDSLAKMADWKVKEQKYLERRNQLVEKKGVADSLFSVLDMCLRWIVGEYPVAVTDRLIAIALSKRKTARIEMIALQEKELSKRVKGTKDELVRDLKKIED